MAKPIPPSAGARKRPTPPSACRLGLGEVPLRADGPIPGTDREPEKCRTCRASVYEAEDSEAFCRERWCPFRLRVRQGAKR